LNGYFYVGFAGYASDKVPIDASAEDLTTILERIPTIGNVRVSRSENIDGFGFSWSVTFLNSEWWNGQKFYDMPMLSLANVDSAYAETDFTPSVVSTTGMSTFSGSDGHIAVESLVRAMAGYEQQTINIAAHLARSMAVSLFPSAASRQRLSPRRLLLAILRPPLSSYLYLEMSLFEDKISSILASESNCK